MHSVQKGSKPFQKNLTTLFSSGVHKERLVKISAFYCIKWQDSIFMHSGQKGVNLKKIYDFTTVLSSEVFKRPLVKKGRGRHLP